MDSTMNLTIGIKGSQKLGAQSVPLQEGYLKLGGIVDNAGDPLPFGVVVSAETATPAFVSAGTGTGRIVRGIAVFDDAIAQNAPAHSNSYLSGFQCAIANKGLVQLQTWETGQTPAIGNKVQFNDDTGEIGFTATTATTDHTLLEGATVVEVTDDSAFVWLA